MSSAASQDSVTSERSVGLDAARGAAVVGMIYLHFLPAEGTSLLAELARLFEGKPAALFCVLAGMSWSLQARRRSGSAGWAGYVAWRAITLGAAGVLLAVTVWGTEVLTALALMMPLYFLIQRGGRRGLAIAAVLLLAAVPFATERFGGYAWSDWNEDGTHLAQSRFGLVTLRFYLFDGNYPLLPWLAFPLIGGLCLPLLERRGRARLALAISLPSCVALQGYASWAAGRFDDYDPLAPFLTSTWVPTSLPFFALGVSAAIAVISFLLVLEQAAPRVFARLRWLAALGQASLTHYLLHVLIVFVPLRHLYPDEDWSTAVGGLAFLGYFAFAIPATLRWFRHFRRGPAEQLWAWRYRAR